MSEKFKARYQVNDGYAGPARPQHFTIDSGDLNEDMSDEDLKTFYEEMVEEDFSQRITPYAERTTEFVVWAREQLTKREARSGITWS